MGPVRQVKGALNPDKRAASHLCSGDYAPAGRLIGDFNGKRKEQIMGPKFMYWFLKQFEYLGIFFMLFIILLPVAAFGKTEMYDSEEVHGSPSHVHVNIPRYDLEDQVVTYLDGKYWFDNEGKCEQAIGGGVELNQNGVWTIKVGYSMEWGRN